MGSSKGTYDYWYKRVRKNSFKRKDGSTYTSPDYEVYMSLDGKQTRFNLESGNKDVAAEKALEIFMYIRANGASATLQKYKKNPTNAVTAPTVGDLLTEIKDLKLVKDKTLATYSRKFRSVVAEAFAIKGDKSRYDHHGEGSALWRKKVDAVKLSEITPAKMLNFRACYLEKAPQDPLSQKKAKSTVTSLFRNSKALFSKRIVPHLSFKLPHNPFEDISIGGPTTRQYKSEIDFVTLAQKAKDELYVKLSEVPKIDPENKQKTTFARNEALSQREQLKILLLCLGCGLRRGEADNLLWQKVDFENDQIRIETTSVGGVKAEASERLVDVGKDVMKLLEKFHKERTGDFVIESNIKPNPTATYDFYRCNRHFNKLIKWLHGQGVSRVNAIHELRKEYGSQVMEKFGMYVASQALGHAEVTTTARSYLEKKGHKSISIF